MRVTIHRGTDQIGGCVTEYEHKGFRLFVDYGEQLPGAKKSQSLEIEGLTKGDLSKSALLITHYHGDHIGCISSLSDKIPIYMGKVGREIQMTLSKHLSTVDGIQKEVIARLKKAKTFIPGESLKIGPFTIMAIIIDHSAFDAYAFKIEADKVKFFHTGDFRTHGFRSSTLPKVIEKYVGHHVDYVVCEATNVSRPDATSVTEPELQRQYEKEFKAHKGNVVYLSSTNIDRLFSLYHAALRAKRPFYVDTYQKKIMDVVVTGDKMWGKSRLYQYGKYEPEVLQYQKGEFRITNKFREFLDTKGYVLVARANERFNRLIKQMPGEKQMYLSMWKGYVDESLETYNPILAKAIGDDYKYMHTSGHCDMKSLHEFFNMIRPKGIIPIHTDNAEQFVSLFCHEWPVIRLHDGESIAPLSWVYDESPNAVILCSQELTGNVDILSRESEDDCYGLKEVTLGYFRTKEECEFILSRTTFCPDGVLGYMVSDDEDFATMSMKSFDSQMKPLASYVYGGHAPNELKYQEPIDFQEGEKILAVFQEPYNAVVPAILSGPVTPESARQDFEMNDTREYYDKYEDYVKDWDDWQWDSVEVHPLVKLKTKYYQMVDTMVVPRVYIFPHQSVKK